MQSQTRTRFQRSNIPRNKKKKFFSLYCTLPKLYFETKFNSAGNMLSKIGIFKEFNSARSSLMMRGRELKVLITEYRINKMGAVKELHNRYIKAELPLFPLPFRRPRTRSKNIVLAQFSAFFPTDFRAKERLVAV